MQKYLAILLLSSLAAFGQTTNRYSILTAEQTTNLVDSAISASTNFLSSSSAYIFNVKKYGAVGDGVTDDSAALLSAWTALTNSTYGGVLYFPAGVYVDNNVYTLYGKITPWRRSSAEPFYAIRGDGAGSTFWKSMVNTNSTFILFSGSSMKLSDISFWNGAANLTGKTGFNGAGDSGTWTLSDVNFTRWNVGFDGMGGAGGKLNYAAFFECGTGLRLSGYCDGWEGVVNIRNCWRTGIEIGGTNIYGVLRTRGSNLHVLGAKNNIGIVVGHSSNTRIKGYFEKQTNGIVAVGHPPEFGEENEDGKIRSLNLEIDGIPDAGGPGVALYAKPVSLKIDGVLPYATGRGMIESMVAAADSSPIQLVNSEGALFKRSNGTMVFLPGNTVKYNMTEASLGGLGTSVFKEIYSEGTDTNVVKKFQLGQLPWDSDWYRPQLFVYGNIVSSSSAILNFGGGRGGEGGGRPYSGINFWLGDPSATGAGSNVLSILPSGLWGNGAGLTNLTSRYSTNQASAAFDLSYKIQFIDRTSTLNISGFGGRVTGYASDGRLFVKNSGGSAINVSFPAGTSVMNVIDGTSTCSIESGKIGRFDYVYYPEVITNFVYYPLQ